MSRWMEESLSELPDRAESVTPEQVQLKREEVRLRKEELRQLRMAGQTNLPPYREKQHEIEVAEYQLIVLRDRWRAERYPTR